MFSWSQRSAGPTNTKRKDNRRQFYLDRANALFYLSESFLLTQEQKINDVRYHHYYSPVPSGGPWATKGWTCDTSESEAARTQDQRAYS
jgi:hypothetical protein